MMKKIAENLRLDKTFCMNEVVCEINQACGNKHYTGELKFMFEAFCMKEGLVL